MKIHHLNLGTLRPPGSALTGYPETLTCHCLAVETDDGVVLVDTGFGLEDAAMPRQRLGMPLLALTRPRLDPEETAARQLARVGLRRSDVRHIILTHLDADHAGGLADFPDAVVHVHTPEHRGATARATANERYRYRPAQWAHEPRWALHDLPGDRWRGLQCLQNDGLPQGFFLIPLRGHTRGHCAVAIEADGGSVLHCGDAVLLGGEIDGDPGDAARALAWYHEIEDQNREAGRASRDRLRAFARAHPEVRIVSAHDPEAFARACGNALA